MKIIEKIEIKHFRSFLGTPKQYDSHIENLADFNIFSGANDSGKSNVLRALNLFFNNEISSGVPFDFNRDFFQGKKDAGHKVIEISVTFNLSTDPKRDKFLPDRFTITKFYDRNGFRNHVYTFKLKEHAKEIRVDDRSERNSEIANFFLPKNPTEADKKSAQKREWNYRVKFAGFLNKSVSFDYVPAIRDKGFFAQLFGRVITKVKSNEEQRIINLQKEKNKIANWEKTIKNKTEKRDFVQNLQNESWRKARLIDIENETKKESKLATTIVNLETEINNYAKTLLNSVRFLDSEFKIGKDLQQFFEGFDIGTGSSKSISLALRGDGVQAKYVPKILNFLSEIDLDKKYCIWGFEEPENSAEYKNQQELASELKNNFSEKKQIFITTHSEEFLQLYDSSEILKPNRNSNLYHVKKLNSEEYGDYSFVYLFDAEKNEFKNSDNFLDGDLGQSYLRAKYSKELKASEEAFLEEKRKTSEATRELHQKLKSHTKPLVFIEDKYDQIYKIAWLSLFEISFDLQTFESVFERECPFSIFRAEGASSLSGFLRTPNIDFWSDRKVVGIFDFDVTGVAQFKCIKNKSYWKDPSLGVKTSGIFKKRLDHSHFYALLLPIPDELNAFADLDFPSVVEIENLLPKSFIDKYTFANEITLAGGVTFPQIKEAKKPVIWKDLFELKKEDFKNFRPLFQKIYELLEIP